jgi:hypothetical protein
MNTDRARFLCAGAMAFGALLCCQASVAANKCNASGTMAGNKFSATNCVASFYSDQNSVGLWFSESPITAQQAEDFQKSGEVLDAGEKHLTVMVLHFCPGGGKPASNAAAVKDIELMTNYAKSNNAGVQTVLKTPQQFKVEKMSGELKPGGTLAGKISGNYAGSAGKTSFDADFEVTLPAKDSFGGTMCQ